MLIVLYFLLQVRLHLLTAAMKCFFKRPPETQKALGAALAAGLADTHQACLDFSSARKNENSSISDTNPIHLINMVTCCRMSMIGPYFTIGFCNMMLL